MKKLNLAVLLLIAAACIPAHANTIPISGTFLGSAALSPTPSSLPYSGTETFTGTGVDSTFGSFSGQESASVFFDGATLSLTGGTFSWTFGTGILAGTFSGSGSPGAVAINFFITSGWLAGDSGSGSATESFGITSSNTAAVSGTYSGAINTSGIFFDGPNGPEIVATTPLPAALPLFAGGLGVIGLLARRRKKKD